MSKQCRNCGAELPEDASFCPRCAQSQIERREVKPPRLWRKKALITAGCALVLAAAVLCPSLAVRGGEKDASISSEPPVNTVVEEKNDVSVSSEPPANIVVDGEEISAKDFLIAHLSAYMQSDAYLARAAEFEKATARQAQPIAVTYAFELKLDGWGKENQSLHFFMVKANCDSFVDGIFYDSVTMAIDYDTGAVYDRYSVDESWLEKSEKEQAIYIAAEGGCFPDNYYSGEPIFSDSETHISLSDSDIAEINQALRK